MLNPIAAFQSWRYARRLRRAWKHVAHLPVGFVEPSLSVMNRRAEDYENGKLYRCVYCSKWFVHDDRHSAYGYCIECS